MPVDLEIVRELALSMDDVEECTSYGTPAFKASGKLFARLHQDGETLIVHMNIDQRDDLIAVEPDKFYITDHYRDYQWILIRMSQVSTDEVGRLLKAARDSRSPQKRKKTRA